MKIYEIDYTHLTMLGKQRRHQEYIFALYHQDEMFHILSPTLERSLVHVLRRQRDLKYDYKIHPLNY